LDMLAADVVVVVPMPEFWWFGGPADGIWV
jgi:hypothetical protein